MRTSYLFEKTMTISTFDRALNWLGRHWIVIFSFGAGFFVVLPFLAPVFMMVSMFSSLWLLGLAWYPLRKRIARLPWWGLVLFLLSMVIDGGSHIISDLEGFGGGFRDSNAWLAVLTNNIFPASFYAGDALGSFNSIMRLLTGVLFGVGTVWYAFPFLDDAFSSITQVVAYKRQSLTLYQQEKSRILGGVNHG